MAKRIKKPPVRPETRENWLERYEKGESPPRIAKKDEFDVRTVRKHIDIAKQEREMKEARAAVVRGALEQHYRDICYFAEKLDAEISAETSISQLLRADRMWGALRQHQPRSPLWNLLLRWDNLQDGMTNSGNKIRRRLEKKLRAAPRLNYLSGFQYEAAVSGVVAALAFQTQRWARGTQGLVLDQDFNARLGKSRMYKTQYGSFPMGNQNKQHVKVIRDVIAGYERHMSSWSEYDDFHKVVEELLKIKEKIRDELAVITLRRIVPGRCRYCPL